MQPEMTTAEIFYPAVQVPAEFVKLVGRDEDKQKEDDDFAMDLVRNKHTLNKEREEAWRIESEVMKNMIRNQLGDRDDDDDE